MTVLQKMHIASKIFGKFCLLKIPFFNVWSVTSAGMGSIKERVDPTFWLRETFDDGRRGFLKFWA